MAEEMKITPVSEISDEDVEALRRLTAYYLPLSPTGHGLKPGDIKALLWKAFVYGEHSVIGLLKRLADEINAALREISEAEVAKGNDGVGIESIQKTATSGNVDTYTITLTNGEKITYTVTNGVDGKDGVDGTPGKDGEDGADGSPGKDGVSVTHRWEGTTLYITSASGTSSRDLKGEQGDVFHISKVYASEAAMHAGFSTDGLQEGAFVMIATGDVADEENARLYVKGASSYTLVCDLSGSPGIQGNPGKDGEDGEDGYTPKRGTDFWTDGDIAEIKSYVDDAILNGAW